MNEADEELLEVLNHIDEEDIRNKIMSYITSLKIQNTTLYRNLNEKIRHATKCCKCPKMKLMGAEGTKEE